MNKVNIENSKTDVKGKSDEIVKVDYYNVDVFNQMHKMADYYIKSGALPQSDNIYTVGMKMQAGREMGMAPIESIKSFYFVKGVLSIFGAATTRRLREHGWLISYKDELNKCTATVSKGNEKYTDTLTFEEAVKSGWTKSVSGGLKPGWYEGVNRKLKLRYGVLSLIIKTYIPEVLGSAVDIAEIVEDVGPVITGEVKPEGQVKELPKISNGDDPADEAQLKTIEALGGDELLRETVGKTFTKQEAAGLIKTLSMAKAKGGKQS